MDAFSSMAAGVMGAVAPVVSVGFIAEGKVSGSAVSNQRSLMSIENGDGGVRRDGLRFRGKSGYEHDFRGTTDSNEMARLQEHGHRHVMNITANSSSRTRGIAISQLACSLRMNTSSYQRCPEAN
ncbi:hypothetical protein F5B18DRAFT_654799 [Nemania serpens]|nr:hypothetical protein F5B18DRAFT_654799 [Nemania serpens]